MARVPCQLSDILVAARAKLVADAGFTDPQAWLTLDPDDMIAAPPAPPLAGVTFTAFDQRADTVNAEMDQTDTPLMEGELAVILWTRVPLDAAGRDTQALAAVTLGATAVMTKVFSALNNQDLVNGGGDTITARTLTFLGVRNLGKWPADKNWRRFAVRFSCAFDWAPFLHP